MLCGSASTASGLARNASDCSGNNNNAMWEVSWLRMRTLVVSCLLLGEDPSAHNRPLNMPLNSSRTFFSTCTGHIKLLGHER